MRVSRNNKKKLRICALCITGNRNERNSKYNKRQWINIADDFKFYCSTLTKRDRKAANQL